ncbi:MAG: MFS transporter [Chloroflexi bacterium]|nr:MFS transporter [Chloroflexota bacterium]OJV89636.1 MAG: hypothetical protein BGO39_37405 [Chloroflexi bacterium 54-19]
METSALSKLNGYTPILRLQVGLGLLAFILMGVNDGLIGVLLPSIRGYYGVDKGTVSLIFLAATLGYLTSAFSSGPLSAKIGTRNLLLLGLSSYVLGVTLVSLVVPFLVFPFCLYFSGLGIGIIDAGLNSYFVNFPRSTVLMNTLHAFYGVGALIGPLVASGMLALDFFWANCYIVLVIVGLVVLAGIVFIFRHNPFPDLHAKPAAGDAPQRGILSTALRVRNVWLCAAFLLFYVGVEVSMGTWSYSLLTEERHQDTLLSGWAVSGYWLGLTLGRLILGHVGERIGNKRLIQWCLAGVVVGVLLVWVAPFEIISAAGLVLTGFSLGPLFPTTITLISGLVPARVVATAIGFAASLGSMGAAFFPWFTGNLAQWFGLWTLLPFMVVLTAGMLAVWFFLLARSRPNSVEEPGPA